MRTTLDLEDDLLAAVKELSRMHHVSAGQMVSRLLRESLVGRHAADLPGATAERMVGGFRPFPARGKVVTNAQIDALRDADGL